VADPRILHTVTEHTSWSYNSPACSYSSEYLSAEYYLYVLVFSPYQSLKNDDRILKKAFHGQSGAGWGLGAVVGGAGAWTGRVGEPQVVSVGDVNGVPASKDAEDGDEVGSSETC
jgi:hypothetical protein